MSDKKYTVGPEFQEVIRELETPRTRAEVVAALAKAKGAQARDASQWFDQLVEAKVIDDANELAQHSHFARGYSFYYWQKVMLQDMARTSSFKRGIDEIVKKGDTVIDVGAGTGVLSLFSVGAGANRVHAIEATDIIEMAKEIAKTNGVQDRIDFHHTNAKTFDRPIQADVIVSEWVGMFLLKEYMYEAFAAVRDRCLKKGGTVLPRRARLYLAPLESSELYGRLGFGFWDRRIFGWDFTPMKTHQHNRSHVLYSPTVEWTEFLSEAKSILDLDCLVDGPSALHFERTVEYKIERSGMMHGFEGHFELDLSPNVMLDTSPFSKNTHWLHAYLPIMQFAVEKDDRLEVHVKTQQGIKIPEITVQARLFRGTQVVHQFDETYISDM